MKTLLVRCIATILVMIMIITTMPLSAFALTAQEQEDIYRVDQLWQDEYHQQYIDWLLNSDNFLYHLDVTEGNIIKDLSYDTLSLDPLERKDNFVNILIAIIDYTYDDMNESSQEQAAIEAQAEFLDALEQYVINNVSDGYDATKAICDAINMESELLLDYVYIPNSNVGQLYYAEIYNKIYSHIDDPAIQAQAREALESFTGTGDWLKNTQKFAIGLELAGMGVNLYQDCLDCLVEIRAYEKTNDQYIELLRYIHSNTTDSALKAACSEVANKLSSSYRENMVNGIIDAIGENVVETIGISVLKDVLSDSNIYARAVIFAYDAGTMVSNWLFNTDDMKKHMQSVYCLNEISEELVPLLNEELANLHYYDTPSTKAAKYASDTIYHMKALIGLRKIGEKSYYDLKNSAYGACMVQVVGGLGWANPNASTQIIESWYSEFTSVINAVEASLYQMIPSSYYYVEDPEPEFDVQDGVLQKYNGNGKNVYITSNIRTIGTYAFNGAQELENIEIFESTSRIEGYAFSNCPNLVAVTIHRMDIVIDENAFYNCNENLTIYGYMGSSAQRYAKSNNINFVCIENPFENAINYRDPNFIIENNVLIEYIGQDSEVYVPYGITAIGEHAFAENEYVRYVVIPDSVVVIESGAFLSCTNLTNVVIGSGVKTIESYAFVACSSLKDLKIPKGVIEIGEHLCGNCASLESIVVEAGNINYFSQNNCVIRKEDLCLIQGCNNSTIPEGVLIIGNGAFTSCMTLESVLIPNSVIRIEDEAFYNCAGLKSISIGNSVEEIGAEAFRRCSSLTSIQIPDSVESIGVAALADCTKLASLSLPFVGTMREGEFDSEFGTIFTYYVYANDRVPLSLKNVTVMRGYIDDYAFDECTTLETVVLGDGVTRVGKYAFYNCENLTDLTIGNSVTSIGEYAFTYCDLRNLKMGENVQEIGSYAFAYCYFLKDFSFSTKTTHIYEGAFSGCSTLTSAILSEGLHTLGDGAFGNCHRLQNITIPNSIENIEGHPFVGCTQLIYNEYENLCYLGNNDNPYLVLVKPVDSFGEIDCYNINRETKFILDSAFSCCYSLTSITIPNNVTRICFDTFSSCYNLTEITIGPGVTVIDGYAFSDCDSLKTVYYMGSEEEWNSISISYFGNSALIDATVLYHTHEYKNWAQIGESEHQAICACGKVYTTNHSWSTEWTIDIEATCTTVGSKSRHCEICGAQTDITEIPGSHSWSEEWTVDIEATCTTAGSKSRHCEICDAKTDITEIPCVHNWSNEWTVDIAPTETTEGSQSKHCTTCDAKTEVTVIPMLTTSSPASDFEYKIIDGEIEISKYIGNASIMSIPAYIEGLPVTKISAFAFYNNTVITTAIIPYTVTEMEYYAFCECENLEKVIIGNGITSIPSSAFSNCAKLVDVDFSKTLIEIQDSAFYGCTSIVSLELPSKIEVIRKDAFYGCTALNAISIPSSLEIIEQSAFYNTAWFDNLSEDVVIVGNGVLIKMNNEISEDLIIPENVRSIYTDSSHGTFAWTLVNNVYIPASLKYWNQYWLNFNAASYIVDENNPYFQSVDGVLYNNDRTKLVAFPSQTDGEFVIPNGVLYICDGAFYWSNLESITLNEDLMEIGNYAFYFCREITNISIPDSVTNMGESVFSACDKLMTVVLSKNLEIIPNAAFFSCSKLKSVAIGNKVTQIESAAFNGCRSLEIINYDGTTDQWRTIKIESIGNSAISNATINCISSPEHTHEYSDFANYDSNQHKKMCQCGDFHYEEHNWVYVSCELARVCENCEATEETPLGHSFVHYISNNDATYTEDGTKTATCERCDKKDTLTDLGSALGLVQNFKDEVAALSKDTAPEIAYAELYSAMQTYAALSDEEKQSVQEEHQVLCQAVHEYNEKVKTANGELADATEVALAPITVTGFAFLAALWFLLKKKFLI